MSSGLNNEYGRIMSGSEGIVKEEVKLEQNSLLHSTGIEEDNQDVEESNNNHDEKELLMESSRKRTRTRPRKKKIYGEICQQIEFYFSDANISKNRMMQELVTNTEEEYVDVKIFLTFHKIQKLIPDGNIVFLQKALANSSVLVLSEDLTGVKRLNPYDPKKLKSETEIEKCTIYVENIPAHFDHDKLKKIFEEFGPIAYVAIPKAHSGLFKGFAFVEFETCEGAESCLNAYGDIGACLPSNLNPEDLQSVKTFEPPSYATTNTNPQEKSSGNSRKRPRPTDEEYNDDGEQGIAQPTKKKDKKTIVEEVTTTTPTTNDNVDGKNPTAEMSTTNEIPTSTSSTSNGDNNLNQQIPTSTSDENHNKSEKKRRRKNYKTKKIESIEQCESESIQLRIMAKKNWKQLRSRYLNVQREHLGKLKNQLRHQKPSYHQRQHHQQQPSTDSHKEHGRKESKHVLVKIEFPQPLEDVDAFKHKVKNELMPPKWTTALQYIDCFPNHAIVKIDGQVIEAVSKFVHNASSDYQDVEILSAAASKKYWESVRGDLNERKKKGRGRDKVMENAMKSSKHIHFVDEDEEVKTPKPLDSSSTSVPEPLEK